MGSALTQFSIASCPEYPCRKVDWENRVCLPRKPLGPVSLTPGEGKIAWPRMELLVLTWWGCSLQGECSGSVTFGMSSSSPWEYHLQTTLHTPLCSSPCPFFGCGDPQKKDKPLWPTPLLHSGPAQDQRSLCLIWLPFHVFKFVEILFLFFSLLWTGGWFLLSPYAMVRCYSTDSALAVY